MAQGPIENPVINSPFVEPTRHFVMSADGQVTGEVEPRRRLSEFFVPVARPKKASGAQLSMDQFGGPQKQQRAIYAGTRGEKRLLPSLRPYEPIGSTDDVRFETTKVCYTTTRSHLNLVVQDSGWESKLAEVLESIPEVVAYAKNQSLNFKIPYTYEGRAGNYVPDFLIRLRDAGSTGPDDLLTLVLEVSGEARKDKQAKVATAETLWIPAVNNWGGLGRWAFLEVTDPWDAGTLIREKFLAASTVEAHA